MNARDEHQRKSVSIHPADLQDEFVRLPADYAYWSGQYADALERHLLAESAMDNEHARLYLLRSIDTTKKFTVEFLKASIQAEPTYQGREKEFILSKVEVTRLRGVLDAIQAKRDMLQQLGARVREEMRHDPIIRAQARNIRDDQ